MQIVIDKLLTDYEIAGKGKLVLLLHGWGDSSKSFTDLKTDLSRNYRVLAIDLPGFGATQPPPVAWNLDDYSRFLNSFLAKLGLEPYAVIGHSNGGALAIRAISLERLKPRKLVLLAASGIRGGGRAKRLVLKIIAKTGDVATLWMPERYRRGLRKSLYGAAGSDMLVAPQLQETFKKTVRQNVAADAAKITIPVLLLYAKDDRAVSLVDGETYHNLMEKSELQVIKDAGHFVHHDQPAEVDSLVEDFLK